MTDHKELDARIGIQTDFAKKAIDEANAKAKEEFDNVNHPSHYVSHPSGVETINITREFEFALGNAWKYLMRFRYKGKPKEDLEKAESDLKEAIEKIKAEMLTQFDAGFNKINENFQKIFKELFGGGRAMLELDYSQVDDK